MIEIVKAKSWRLCTCCRSIVGVVEIYFRAEHQGTGVALCEDCRKILREELDRIDVIQKEKALEVNKGNDGKND